MCRIVCECRSHSLFFVLLLPLLLLLFLFTMLQKIARAILFQIQISTLTYIRNKAPTCCCCRRCLYQYVAWVCYYCCWYFLPFGALQALNTLKCYTFWKLIRSLSLSPFLSISLFLSFSIHSAIKSITSKQLRLIVIKNMWQKFPWVSTSALFVLVNNFDEEFFNTVRQRVHIFAYNPKKFYQKKEEEVAAAQQQHN